MPQRAEAILKGAGGLSQYERSAPNKVFNRFAIGPKRH